MILKFSYIYRKQYVKAVENGYYAVYDLKNKCFITQYLYNYIFPFSQGRATVIKDGKKPDEYLEIDLEGKEHFTKNDFSFERSLIWDADYCPNCYPGYGSSVGCRTCLGWGIIPVNQDWNVDDNF